MNEWAHGRASPPLYSLQYITKYIHVYIGIWWLQYIHTTKPGQEGGITRQARVAGSNKYTPPNRMGRTRLSDTRVPCPPAPSLAPFLSTACRRPGPDSCQPGNQPPFLVSALHFPRTRCSSWGREGVGVVTHPAWPGPVPVRGGCVARPVLVGLSLVLYRSLLCIVLLLLFPIVAMLAALRCLAVRCAPRSSTKHCSSLPHSFLQHGVSLSLSLSLLICLALVPVLLRWELLFYRCSRFWYVWWPTIGLLCTVAGCMVVFVLV